MSALMAFCLGIAYALGGLLALLLFADRYGTRIGRRLEKHLLAQLAALAVWPLTLLADVLLLWLRPRNRRCVS